MKTSNDGTEELAARTGFTAQQIRDMPCMYKCGRCPRLHYSIAFANNCCPPDYAAEIKQLQDRISLLESILLK